jgi:hypothetical protein
MKYFEDSDYRSRQNFLASLISVVIGAFQAFDFAKGNGTIRKRLLGLVFDGLTLGNCELNLYFNETATSAEAVQQIIIQKSSENSSEDSLSKLKILHFKNSVRRNAAFGLAPKGARDRKVFFTIIW